MVIKQKVKNINSSIVTLVQIKYNGFIKSPDREFCIGIADYMDFLYDIPFCRTLLNSFSQEEMRLQMTLDELQYKASIDEKKAASELFETIKQKNINFPQLNTALKEYNYFPHYFEDLEDVISALYENGYKDLVSHFVDDHKGLLNFKISKHYEPMMKVYGVLIDGSKTAHWGALKKLREISDIVKGAKLEAWLGTRGFPNETYRTSAIKIHQYIIGKLTLDKLSLRPPVKKLKKELNQLIKKLNIKNAQRVFLEILNDFKPREFEDIELDMRRILKKRIKNITSIKFEVSKKLEGSNFAVQSVDSNKVGKSFYQLEYLS